MKLSDNDLVFNLECINNLSEKAREEVCLLAVKRILETVHRKQEQWFEFTLDIDCSSLSTSQQKKVSFVSRRIFTNKRVARTKKVVARIARPYAVPFTSHIPYGSPIELDATYYYHYPKGTPKCRLVDGSVKSNGPDLDNLHKAVQDALGPGDRKRQDGAHLWPDDRLISTLHLHKRFTTGPSRIVFRARIDKSRDQSDNE